MLTSATVPSMPFRDVFCSTDINSSSSSKSPLSRKMQGSSVVVAGSFKARTGASESAIAASSGTSTATRTADSSDSSGSDSDSQSDSESDSNDESNDEVEREQEMKGNATNEQNHFADALSEGAAFRRHCVTVGVRVRYPLHVHNRSLVLPAACAQPIPCVTRCMCTTDPMCYPLHVHNRSHVLSAAPCITCFVNHFSNLSR